MECVGMFRKGSGRKYRDEVRMSFTRKEVHAWSGSAWRCGYGLIRCSGWLCMHAENVRLTCKVHVFDGDKCLVKLSTEYGIDIGHIFVEITITLKIRNKKMLQTKIAMNNPI